MNQFNISDLLLTGITGNVDLGVNFPSRNFELIRDVNLISEQEYEDIKTLLSVWRKNYFEFLLNTISLKGILQELII